MTQTSVSIRAIRSYQAGRAIYTFFLPGSKIVEIADISRITKSKGQLEGFQREAIQRHISGMVAYLDSGEVLFPNAMLLALSPSAKFTCSRGPSRKGLINSGQAGVLKLTSPSDGSKCAWIVDGQQRSMALARAKSGGLPVPVVAFVSDEIDVHREQFILVNKARPLSKRLIDELLPEVQTGRLPADMAMRQIPSALVERLDSDPASPFHGMIRRISNAKDQSRFVIDSALVKAIQRQLNQPLGALASFRSLDGGANNPDAMYGALLQFWTEVKKAFPAAWGLPPEQSRLMHSTGIAAMSDVMTYLTPRASQHAKPADYFAEVLRYIAPRCAWTTGSWPDLNCRWNQVEGTSKHVKHLTEQLIRLTQQPPLREAA